MSQPNEELFRAIGADDCDRVASAVRAGADLHAAHERGMNALQWSVFHAKPGMFSWLLSQGMKPDAVTKLEKRTAIELALDRGRIGSAHEEIVEAAVGSGANIHWRSFTRQSVLHMACAGDSLRLVQFFLEKGVDPNEADCRGRRPLHALMDASTGIERRIKDICLALLHAGADLEAGDERGVRPIHLAALSEMRDRVLLLRSLGASNHAVGAEPKMEYAISCTPLKAAVVLGDVDVMMESLQRHGSEDSSHLKEAVKFAHENDPSMEALILSWIARESARQALSVPGAHP